MLPAVAEPATETPIAVCALSLDDQPVVDVAVVRTGTAYDLTLDMRLQEWPGDATRCEVELLTTLPPDALTRPRFTFTAAAVRDEHGVRLSPCASG